MGNNFPIAGPGSGTGSGGNVTTSETLTDDFVLVGNGAEDIGISTASFIGNDLSISGDVSATNYNGVPLTAAGVSTNYLDETGNYSIPPMSSGNVTTSATLTDNFIVIGNGTSDIDVSTASFSGNDLSVVGSLTIENGANATPSLNFTSHITTGLSASSLGLELSVNGIEALGIRTSTTPVNGLLLEMADTGDSPNIVPVGPDGSIGLTIRGKAGNINLNNINGDVLICAGPVMTVSPTGTAVTISGDVSATNYNGVPITTAGVSTNYLDETGNYSAPSGSGGNVTTSATLTDNFLVVGNGTVDVDVSTASFTGDDLSIVGSLTVENGATATPSYNFTSHTTTGLSASNNALDLSVNGVIGIGVQASTTPVNGLFVEMSDTGGAVNLVPEGTDGTIDLVVRAKGADVRINQIAGDTFIGIDDQINVQNGGSTGIGRGVGTPSHTLEVATEASDTIAIARFSSTLTDAGSYRIFCGTNDPNTHVTGFPGDVYQRASGEISGSWESLESASGTEWFSRSLNPPTVIVINKIAQFEDLVSGGTFSVFQDTLLVMNIKVVTSSNIFILFGFNLSVIGRYKGLVGFDYTGAGIFISGEGSFIAAQRCELEGSGTGQLFDLTGKAALVVLKEIKLESWDKLGSLESVGLVVDTVEIDNVTTGLDMINLGEVSVKNIFQDGTPMASSLFTFDTFNIGELYTLKDIRGNLTSTGSIFDFSVDIPTTTQIAVSECLTDTGSIFKQTQASTESFTLVSDSTVVNTITAAVDNGSGLTRLSSSEDIFDGDLVEITNTTNYNGTFKAFDVVLGVSFDINKLFVGGDSGNLESKRILLFANPNTVSNGDAIEVINSQFYNGFYRVLDSTSDEIEINHPFEGTDSGDVGINVGLSERDPRVKAFNNFSGNADSKALIFSEVNGNTVSTNVSSNAKTYSTVQLNITNSQSTERFRLISSDISAYIYTGIEDITVLVAATFTMVKSGGDANYRIAVTKNNIDPTSDTVGFVPVIVGTTTTSGTFEAEFTLSTGDEVVPKIVGDGTSVAITVTDFRMIVR